MKALLLAGGRGKRLEEVTLARNKCMTPVNGRPVIEHNLQHAVRCGVDEIVVVVGYRAEDIINHFGVKFGSTPLRYVIQWEQRGLVHAIECAREALGESDFLLLLGDEVMVGGRHAEFVAEFRNGDNFIMCGVLPVTDRNVIRKTYTIIQDESRVISRLIEKPKNPLNHWMGTGVCVFRSQALAYIALTPIHHERSEKELPDLIQCAIDDGKTVRSFNICDCYTNINTKEDLLLAESFVARS